MPSDLRLMSTFFRTYPMFTDSTTIVKALVERCILPPPKNCSQVDFAVFKKQFLDLIRLRVVCVIKYWVTVIPIDTCPIDMIYTSIVELFLHYGSPKNGQLLNMIIRSAQHQKDDCTNYFPAKKSAAPIIPSKQPELVEILHWDLKEVARQVTLFEFSLFNKICIYEFLNLNWILYKDKAPNLCQFISWNKNFSSWISSQIVQEPIKAKRVMLIEKFVTLASELYSLYNFNALYSIICGLNHASVKRLKITWGKVATKVLEKFSELSSIVSSDQGFKKFKVELRCATTPLVPILDCFLLDLTFIMETQSDNKYGEKMINIEKCKSVEGVIRTIEQYQVTKFDFEVVEVLKNKLMAIVPLGEEELHVKSYECEQ